MVSAPGGHWRGRTDGLLRRSYPLQGLALRVAAFPRGHLAEKQVCSEASPKTRNQEDVCVHILLRERDRQTEAGMDLDREGESNWPQDCVLGRSELRRVGWQAGDLWGDLLHLESKTWKQLLGTKVGNSGTMSCNSACRLRADFLFLQEISVFALKALQLMGQGPPTSWG